MPPPPSWQSSVPIYRLLWSQIFDGKQPTLVIAADSDFALVQDLDHRSMGLQEYIERSFIPRQDQPGSQAARLIAGRQYTSFADLNILTRILQIHPRFAQLTQIRFARYAELRDFRNRNAILLGSPRGNPWTELFEGRLNFLARYDPATGQVYFHNVAPRPGEPQRFARNEADGQDYATVALLRNLGNTGWVLILSGLTSHGTEAAGEAVIRPDLCWKLLQAAGLSPKGALAPFEVLLRVKAVAGGPSDIAIVACRRPRT
ncbi:MAG: hypothetical protein ACP5U2_06555 [Bryobacteraceae bacterium]